MKLFTKKSLFRHGTTFAGAVLALSLAFTGCGLFSEDEPSADDSSIGSLSASLDSTKSAVVSNLIANSEESYVDLTLSLSGTAFSFAATGNATPSATNADDLSGSIIVTAGTATADRVYPLADIAAGAATASVRAYIAADAVESGSIGVTVKGNALKSRRVLSGTAGSYTSGGITVSKTNAALQIKATTDTSWDATSKSYTLTLSQSGYKFAETLTGLVNVIDASGENFSGTTVSVTRTSDTVATVTVAETVTVINEEYATGTLVFSVDKTAVVKTDGSANIGEDITCVSEEGYTVNGGTAAIAIGETGSSTASYSVRGMTNATITSNLITLTLTNAYFASTATSDCITLVDSTVSEDDENSGMEDLTITDFTLGEAGSDGKIRTVTFKVKAVEQLASVDENFTSTISFKVAALGEVSGTDLELTSEGSLDLSFVYYPGTHLEAPTAAQMINANTVTGTGAVTAESEVTVIVFDEDLGYTLKTNVSAGDTVATGTVGTTNVTFVALTDTAAGAKSVPVKVAATGLTGEVSLTISKDLVTNADADVTFTQTDTTGIATLAYYQNFENTTVESLIGIQAADMCNSEIATSALTGNKYWRHYFVDAGGRSGARVAYTNDNLNTITASKSYTLEFDAALTPMANNKDFFLVSTTTKTDGNNMDDEAKNPYVLYMTTAYGASASKWTFNGSGDVTSVTLTNGETYHFTLKVSVGTSSTTVTLSISNSSGDVISDVPLKIQGSSYAANSICLGVGLGTGAEQTVDNIVLATY